MKAVMPLLLVLCFVALADTVTQIDWSGGAGVAGPVIDWENKYLAGSQVSTSDSTVQIHLTTFSSIVDDNFDGANSVYTIDMDDDGDMDILGAAQYAEDIVWWENYDGSGTAWAIHIIQGNFYRASNVCGADFDNDGDIDVMGASYALDTIKWWENTNGAGTEWTQHIVTNDFDFVNDIYVADIDNDGDMDVLGAAISGDEIAWWENTNPTDINWIKHTVNDNLNGASAVLAADINGDGTLDILGATHNSKILWWESTDSTATTWTEHPVDLSFFGTIALSVSDIDGDNDIDILGASYSTDQFAWWENEDGTGENWTIHVFAKESGPMDICACDLDDDGDEDIIGLAHKSGKVIWWENSDGTGASLIRQFVTNDFIAGASVCTGDMDGNGNPNIIACTRKTSDNTDVMWWRVPSYYHEYGTLTSSILDAGNVDQWDNFTAGVSRPTGTSFGFQFRSSNDSDNMGTWSDTLLADSADLSKILTDSTQYLQYQVLLFSDTTQNYTPVLNYVLFTYSTSMGTASGDEVNWSLTSVNNPSGRHYSAILTVPETSTVSLILFDISGRIIAENSQEFTAGTHSVNFAGLSEGTYFCMVKSDEFSTTEKIIILNQ